MRAAAVRICFTGRTRRRASNTLRPIPAARNAASSSAVRQIFPRTGANAALSGCSTNTFQPTGPTVAQVLSTFSSAEVAADRRSGLRRGERPGHLGKSQGTIRESSAVRVRDGYASGVDRVDVSGRPETGLPDKVLNHPEIECLANDSGSWYVSSFRRADDACRFPSPRPPSILLRGWTGAVARTRDRSRPRPRAPASPSDRVRSSP